MKKPSLFMITLVLAGILASCGVQSASSHSASASIAPSASVSSTASDSTVSQSSEPKADPIYGNQIDNGTYEITVDSSSSMFRITKCELAVENGSMQAVMTMSGQGYGKLYMGTGEQALESDESAYIPFVLNNQGEKTFTVPVEALNKEIDCAAWSIKKEKWYDRVLIFNSDLIPAEAMITE